MRSARNVRVFFLVCAAGFLAAPVHAQWQPPIGIPAPSFGITQTAPPAPNPWTNPVPGFYYVEQKAGATNVNNPYGTPAKPRISIPNPIPAGSVVELHGFYDVGQSSPNTLVAQGTAAKPVFIRGVSTSARPIIRRAWEVTGTYFILENLEFGPTPDQSVTGSLVVLSPTSYMAIRHSDLHGTLDDGGMGVENWNGGASRVDHVVIWDNVFHDNGDVLATFDQDVEGIHVGSHASFVWVVDNEMARNSGDGIQINATEEFKATTNHIFVGRNVSHHNKQGGFWVKQAVDVIFSQNTAYSHRPGNSSLGHCLGAQYAPDYVWWIYNTAFDCEFGIAVFSDWVDGQTTHQFFVGNVIRSIHNTQAGVNPNDDWSPAAITVAGGWERHFVNNTFNDVDSGINIASPFGTAEIKNNIITNLSQSNGNHVNIGFGSVVDAPGTSMDHNLFFPTPRISLDGDKFFPTAAQLAVMKSLVKDPLFRNPSSGDFHIPTNSPAAGSGEISNVYGTFQNRYGVSILVDADANPRPQTTSMDMGAYSTGGWGILYVDLPTPGSVISGNAVTMSGWAIDKSATSGSGVDAVHVYATPAGGSPQFMGVATYGASRPDIGNYYGAQFTPSGFSMNLTLPNGNYVLTAYGHSTVTNAFSVAVTVPITVLGPVSQPAIALGGPLSGSTSGKTVAISGWAIDLGAPGGGTGVDAVHVYATPSGGGASTFIGAATYGLSRPDVANIFGSRFTNSGFQLQVVMPPGNYTFTAYMHSTLAGFNAAVTAANVTVNATDSNAQMMFDQPTNITRTRPFTISGWAIDSGAPSGSGIDAIHVWVFPAGGGPQFFGGVATYGLSRPDVGSNFGDSRFNNSGFALTVTSSIVPTPGIYDFYVYAHSTVTGNFPIARILRVTVN